VIGDWYYFSVFTNTSGSSNQGTFSLCVNDIRPNDDKAGAWELTQKNNWCSALAAYNNVGATPDGTTGSCGSPYNNVWFKFQAATQYIKLDAKTGSTEGTSLNLKITLWNSAGAEAICASSSTSSGDVSIEKLDLVVGEWYYASIHSGTSSASNQGTFTLCVNDQPSFNHKIGAITLTQKTWWCSALAAYDNTGATADGNSSTCGAPNSNVWFKFLATTQYIKLDVKTGSTEGTIKYPEIALWSSTGTEVICQNNALQLGDVSLEKFDLTIGQWYYVSVYNGMSSAGDQGTFSLCVNDNRPNDNKVDAFDLPQRNNWCSANAAYRNTNATADGSSSTCGTPNNNVWFKFQATTAYIKIDVKTGGAEGTIQTPEVALWNSSNVQVACQDNTVTTGDVSIEKFDLTINQWYYISIYTSASSASNQGTYSLCINDQIPFNYKDGAIELAQRNLRCALGAYNNVGATADGSSSTCGAPNNNVWFKFQATTNYVKIDVKTGGDEGTIKTPEAALWNSSNTLVLCVDNTVVTGDVTIEKLDLTVGQWYYLSVQTANTTVSDQGSFTICVNDQITFNSKSAAIELTDRNNWSSGLAAYDNFNATIDGPAGSCNGLNSNVWFKFQATTAYLDLKLKTGGDEGTMLSPQVALFDNAGTALICQGDIGSTGSVDDPRIEKPDMIPGQWYYISIYNATPNLSYQGSFSLSINDQITPNYKGGAIELTQKNNWCSGMKAYNNVGATPDGIPGSCGATNNNVWFKFQATTTYARIDLKTGDTEGNIRYPELTLYDANGTVVGCTGNNGVSGDIKLEKLVLTANQYYFLSVSTNLPSDIYEGTFTLCLNDQIPIDHQAGAKLLTDKNSCSAFKAYDNLNTTSDGTAGSCANTYNNVWFKFQASTQYIKIDVKTGYNEGSIRYPEITLSNSTGSPVACAPTTGSSGDVSLEQFDLVLGEIYLIEVSTDQSYSSHQGTFTLCLNDQISFNYQAGAILLTDKNSCSAKQAYSSIGATQDGPAGPCGPQYSNVWFKFLAETPYIKFDVKTASVPLDGTIIGPEVTLWNSSGVAQLCTNAAGAIVSLEKADLSVGSTYFVSVSTQSQSVSSQGTFTICTKDLCDQLPVVFPLSITKFACSNDTLSSLTLADSEPGINYFLNGATQKPGTDAPLTWTNLAAGSYTITARRGNCLQNTMGTVELTVPDALRDFPITKINGKLCGQDSIVLEGSENLVSYQLLKDGVPSGNAKVGDSTFLYWSGLTDAGNYTIRATKPQSGCTAILFGSVDITCEYENVVIAETLSINASRIPLDYVVAVGGNAVAVGVDLKVTSQWPDYVFENDYDLMPLDSVATYIANNKHLPNLPSAEEMHEKQNYSVSDMDVKLLEKIEELTLYVIQLNEARKQLAETGQNFKYAAAIENLFASKQFDIDHYSKRSKFLSSETITEGTVVNFGSMDISGTLSVSSPKQVPSGYKLAVGGNILAVGLDIKALSDWPDYVFDDDYSLPALKDVDLFIREHGHLPGFLSEEEMQKKENYSLGEMDANLLQKIEELTLYIIQLQKKLGQYSSAENPDAEIASNGDEVVAEQSVNTTENLYDVTDLFDSPALTNKVEKTTETLTPTLSSFVNMKISQTLLVGSDVLHVPANFKMAVAGTMIVEQMDIKIPEKWPDYVFTDAHQRMPLDEVDDYIKKYGHLPGLASATEMKEMKHYSVGELDVKLLEKIEELTLYVIELEKEIETQK
jgi:hypothetical protein